MMLMVPPSGDFWYKSCLDPSLTLWEPSVKIPSLCISLYHCSHGPAKWTCWHNSWCPHSPNSSPQVTDAKSTSHQLKNIHLWMDHIWPIWWLQAVLRVHRKLVLSSGNTRRTLWQRCLPGVHPEFPQYHCLPEMESKDTCQCDHRWCCSYQEECKILHGSFSTSDGLYCVSKMSNIPIGSCANQAWRDPRWTGRLSESPCHYV